MKVSIQFIKQVSLLLYSIHADIGNVNCGGHTAPSCSYCPQDQGHYWCNGDCQWNWQTNTCEATSSQRKTRRISNTSRIAIELEIAPTNHILTNQIFLIVR